MKNLLSSLFAWLVLTFCAAFTQAALASCPPDPPENCPPYNYGFTLTLNTKAELGGDIYANWELEAARFWGAPLTVHAGLSTHYILTDSPNIQPPAGGLQIQLTPQVAGYPVSLGFELEYHFKRDGDRNLVYGAYAGPFTFSNEGRSWNVALTLFDSRWLNDGFAPPPGFVPTLDLARLTITPVPEPEIFGMLLAGLGVVGGMARRRSKVAIIGDQ